MKLGSLLGMAFFAASCSAGRDTNVADASAAGLTARFAAFTLTTFSSSDGQGGGVTTSQWMSIDADGTIKNELGDSATMSADDLRTFAAWATSEELVAAVRAGNCSGGADASVSMEVEIGPGVSIGSIGGLQNVFGCGGPIGALNARAGTLAAKYLGETIAIVSQDPETVIEHPERVAVIRWDGLTFDGAALAGPCESSDVCGFIAADGAVATLGPSSGQLTPAALVDIRAAATSPALLEGWPGTCHLVDTSAPTLMINLTPDLHLKTSTSGCADGPIKTLESFIVSAVQTVTDGGAGATGDSNDAGGN